MAIAWRYLRASRRRAHVALLSTISVLGLALGVAALIVSIALLTGFQDRIREQLARTTPHLRVLPPSGAYFTDPRATRSILSAEPDVRRVEEAISGRGWIADARVQTVLPAHFRAVASSPVAPGSARVSSSIAGQLGVAEGSRVLLLSGRTTLSPLGPVPASVPLTVSGILRGGAAEESPDVVLSVADAADLAGGAGRISAFDVWLTSAERAAAAAKDLAGRLPRGTIVRTWSELHAGLAFALHMEKALIFVTVFLVVLVACLNVLSDVSLLVVEKRRDLGVLATLGADGRTLSAIYAWLGGAIGLLGTAVGALSGCALAWAANRYRLVPLPEGVYLMDHVPFALHSRDVLLVVAFSLLTALAASLGPARAASRIGASEAPGLSR